jgi:hypothetical protein
VIRFWDTSALVKVHSSDERGQRSRADWLPRCEAAGRYAHVADNLDVSGARLIDVPALYPRITRSPRIPVLEPGAGAVLIRVSRTLAESSLENKANLARGSNP